MERVQNVSFESVQLYVKTTLGYTPVEYRWEGYEHYYWDHLQNKFVKIA